MSDSSPDSRTVACQAPLTVEFSRQEILEWVAIPSPGDLSDSGIKPVSPVLQADSLPAKPSGKPLKELCYL